MLNGSLTTKHTCLSALGILTFRFRGQYLFHITYNRRPIVEFIALTLTTLKACSVACLTLIGLVCWFLFSMALIGCNKAPTDPHDEYALPAICAKNDSTVKVFDKTYKLGKTERATVYVDEDGTLWLRWPDGTRKPYDEGQVYGCSNPDFLYF
jgi:hypothetical protein